MLGHAFLFVCTVLMYHCYIYIPRLYVVCCVESLWGYFLPYLLLGTLYTNPNYASTHIFLYRIPVVPDRKGWIFARPVLIGR